MAYLNEEKTLIRKYLKIHLIYFSSLLIEKGSSSVYVEGVN